MAQAKANSLYKKLLKQRSFVLGQDNVVEDSYIGAGTSSQYQNSYLGKLAPRPKRRRRIQDDENDKPASSSSPFTDGLYCMPLMKDNEVSPSTLAATRKVQENENEEDSV